MGAAPEPERSGRRRLVTVAEVSAVAVGGLVLFLARTGWQEHPFLWDDNKTQWLPVTDAALADLFRGHFPYLNPYQLGGIRVDRVGYYGVTNPLMILAYLGHRGAGVSNTLSVYLML